ncbi:hypothetical protein DFH06DRAFT_1330275 [Mycena polygramma]|nr:hypothetical protein DFH06DRAFT_1330275 [Mycena polygramma]
MLYEYSDDDDDNRDWPRRDLDPDEEEELERARQETQPDMPDSEYNEHQGIKYMVAFQPTHPPLAPNETRRKNKKLPSTINSVAYIHEGVSFDEMLEQAIRSVGTRCDSRQFRYKIVGGDLRTNAFTAVWTIPRTDFKDMQLVSEKHYDELKKEAVAKNDVDPAVKLLITALELPVAVNDPTDSTEDAGGKAKKRKLTSEEEEIAETIIQLKTAHRCSDRSCLSPFCFVGNPTAKHVRLTPIHLSTWGAAILAKVPNVDINTPPPLEEEKMFWPPDSATDAVDDIALLAARRQNTSNKSHPSAPTITVNNDFTGLAALFQPLLPTSATQGTPVAPPAPTPTIHALPSSPQKQKMTVDQFCTAFELDTDIQARLQPLKLQGPHLLEHLENSILDQYLEIGQRLAVRYAEAQWKKGEANS